MIDTLINKLLMTDRVFYGWRRIKYGVPGIVTDQDLLNVERRCSEGQSWAGGSF